MRASARQYISNRIATVRWETNWLAGRMIPCLPTYRRSDGRRVASARSGPMIAANPDAVAVSNALLPERRTEDRGCTGFPVAPSRLLHYFW